MKNALFAACFLVAVAACSPAEAPQPATTPTPQRTEDGPKPDRSALRTPLPEGVELDFDYRVHRDRREEPEGASPRRRVVLDYLEGDQASVFQAIAASMGEAGFQERSRAETESGKIKGAFRKSRYGTVRVLVTPVGDPKVDQEGGLGRVVLDWPLKD